MNVGLPDTRFPTVLCAATLGLAAFSVVALKVVSIADGPIWLGISGVIATALSVILTLATIGRFVLGPLDAAARHRRRPTQFTMADFLALVFLFQLPVALIRLILSQEAPHGFLYGFAWVASSLMWGLSVQTLSRAGIETPWRRTVFLSAVLPLVYFGSVAFVGAVLLGIVAALFDDQALRLAGFWWYIALCAALPGGFFWAARFVRAMLRQSQTTGVTTPARPELPFPGRADAPDE